MNWEPGRLGVSFCVGGVAHDVMRYEYQGTDFSLSFLCLFIYCYIDYWQFVLSNVEYIRDLTINLVSTFMLILTVVNGDSNYTRYVG
jgi:Ca2+/H+ antiporter